MCIDIPHMLKVKTTRIVKDSLQRKKDSNCEFYLAVAVLWFMLIMLCCQTVICCHIGTTDA
jgi:hypothetical protein